MDLSLINKKVEALISVYLKQVNKLFSLTEFFNSTPIQLVTLASQNGFTTTKITIAINKIVGASLAILKKRAE